MARNTETRLDFALDLTVDTERVPHRVQPFGERPAVTESVNTSFGDPDGTLSKRPLETALANVEVATGSPCGGLIPLGSSDSTAYLLHPDAQFLTLYTENRQKRVSGSGEDAETYDVVAPYSPFVQSSAFWPAQVADAAPVPGPKVTVNPVITVHGDEVITASVARSAVGNNYGVYVSSRSATTGAIVAQPVEVLRTSFIGAGETWIGLSSHGVTGVWLWYQIGATNVITAVKIALGTEGYYETVGGTSTAVYTPLASINQQIKLTYDTVNPGQSAWLATQDSAAAGSTRVHRFDTLALTVTTSAAIVGSSTEFTLSLCWRSAGTTYLVYAYDDGVTTTIVLMDSSTLANLFAPTTVATQPSHHGGALVSSYVVETQPVPFNYAIVGIWVAGSVSASQSGYTAVYYINAGTGLAMATPTKIPWMRPVADAVAVHSPSSVAFGLAATPHLVLQPNYGGGTPTPTSPNFLVDPAIFVFRMNKLAAVGSAPDNVQNAWSCVGRFGVDSAMIYGTVYYQSPLRHSRTAIAVGESMHFNYLEDTIASTAIGDGAQGRYVQLSFETHQPKYAVTQDGATIVAGALPVIWDGHEFLEAVPLVAPKVGKVADSGGAGPALTGTYLVAAVTEFTDNQGSTHRSAPSIVRSDTFAGTSPIYQVSQPASYSTYSQLTSVNEANIRVLFYMSEAGGTVLYLQSAAAWTDPMFALVDPVPTPSTGSTHPPIYTDGSAGLALSAQCPPAARDVAIVGNRAWVVDAEKPWRAWPSKERDLGYGFEWSSDLVVTFPASAGTLAAVVERGGMPVFFTDTGIFAVTGQGPDNNLGGQPFNPPEQVSHVNCTDASSVVACPAGILFRSDDRFCLYEGGQVRIFDGIDAASIGTIRAAVLYQTRNEVVFYAAGSQHYAYHYVLDRWSIWEDEEGSEVAAACTLPKSGNALVARTNETSLDLLSIDAAQPSLTHQLYVRTGWIQPGGPQADLAVQDLLIHVQYDGDHGVECTIEADYGRETFSYAFDPIAIAAATVNNEYVICVSTGSLAMRSFRIGLQETGAVGLAMRPISATVLYRDSGGVLRQAVLQPGRQ